MFYFTGKYVMAEVAMQTVHILKQAVISRLTDKGVI
jgi:hypothetical protein